MTECECVSVFCIELGCENWLFVIYEEIDFILRASEPKGRF